MPQLVPTEDRDNIAHLVQGIVEDTQKLVRQEIELAKAEFKNSFTKAKAAAVSLGIGAIVGLIGGGLLAIGLVHLFQTITNLPLWASYAIMSLVYMGVAIGFILAGKRTAEEVDLLPKDAAQNIKENVQWIKKQI